MVDEAFDRAGVESLVREQVHQHAGVEVAAPRAHHEAARRREAHRRVDGKPVAHGSEAGAVAQVRDDRAAERSGADGGDDVLVRQAVEPVALDALRSECPWQRQALRDGRHPSVERGVEARDLRERGEVGAHSIDARERRRQVEWGERHEGPQRNEKLRRDSLRRGMAGSAMDDAMTDPVERRERRSGEHRAQRRAGVRKCAQLVAEHPCRSVANREAPLAEADPFDHARRDPGLVLVERHLERR